MEFLESLTAYNQIFCFIWNMTNGNKFNWSEPEASAQPVGRGLSQNLSNGMNSKYKNI